MLEGGVVAAGPGESEVGALQAPSAARIRQAKTERAGAMTARGTGVIEFGTRRASASLGTRALSDSDDHVSSFVSLLDVPVGLGRLLQRVATIDDRTQRTRLDDLLEQHQVS